MYWPGVCYVDQAGLALKSTLMFYSVFVCLCVCML